MEEKGIKVIKSDGETTGINLNKIVELMMASFYETLEEIMNSVEETVVTLLQHLAHYIFHFVHGRREKAQRRLFSVVIYIWSFRHKERPHIIQAYDGISQKLRQVYLRHRLKLASETDDSQIFTNCSTC